MDTIPIFKSDVTNYNSFQLLLKLYNCRVISTEDEYYIVEGTPEDIEDFRKDWSDFGGLSGTYY